MKLEICIETNGTCNTKYGCCDIQYWGEIWLYTECRDFTVKGLPCPLQNSSTLFPLVANFVVCWSPLQSIWTQIRVVIWFKPFDTMIVFLKEFFEKMNFEKKVSADDNKSINYPACKELIAFIFDPVHEISNKVVCATSKASDQPAHTRSLIRAFASRLSILWLLSYWLNTIWSF